MYYSIIGGVRVQVVSLVYDKSSNWYAEETHPHSAWTLVLVSYGKCVYWIRDKKVVLEKGQTLLIPGGIPYYGKSVPTLMHEKYTVRFEPEQAAEALPLLRSGSYLCCATGKYELILERMRTMYEQWSERKSYYLAMCEALLQEVLVHMNREHDQGAVSHTLQHLVDQMKEYIQNHYREQVTKELLAEAVGRSPNHTATMFRKVTGQTISEYVHAMRIKTAVYMLRHSALTVTEIAEFVGYGDPSYFYRVFKRITGEVPTSYLSDREAVRR